MPCSIRACRAPTYRYGLCRRHYERQKRHGDPLICLKPLSPRGRPRSWLERHVGYEFDNCLIWPYARFPDGRAHMAAGKPSRIMCEMAHGPAPSPKHQAAHSCGNGNGGCVNPRHLRWATPKENSDDKEIHGTVVRGRKHPAAKLIDEDIRNIRLLDSQGVQRQVIAARFGVNKSCITKILQGTHWKHVT